MCDKKEIFPKEQLEFDFGDKKEINQGIITVNKILNYSFHNTSAYSNWNGTVSTGTNSTDTFYLVN